MTKPATIRCERCGERLTHKTFVYLELNATTGRYSDPVIATIPPMHSQGLFPFGVRCAERVMDAGGRNHEIARKARRR